MQLFIADELLAKDVVDVWGEWWPERGIAIGSSEKVIEGENCRLICHIGPQQSSSALINLVRSDKGVLLCEEHNDLIIFTLEGNFSSYQPFSFHYPQDVSFGLERALHLATNTPEDLKLEAGFTLLLSLSRYFFIDISESMATALPWSFSPTHSISAFKVIKSLPTLLEAALCGDSRLSLELKFKLLLRAVDLFFGIVVAVAIVLVPISSVSSLLVGYDYFNTHMMNEMVTWLTGSPAGLQMNKNLASFLGTISVTSIEVWHSFVMVLSRIGSEFNVWKIIFATTAGFGGISSLLASMIDVLNFLFFHIFFLYIGCLRLWSTATLAIRTTFLLFRGKKMNIMKARVDGHVFDLEQLLLGTVFFSMFVFLIPTVLVFYASFTCLWLMVVLMQISLWAAATTLIQFPLLQFFQAWQGELVSGVFFEAVPAEGGLAVVKIHGRRMGLFYVWKKFQFSLLGKFPIDFLKTLHAIALGSPIKRVRTFSDNNQRRNASEEFEKIRELGKQLFK